MSIIKIENQDSGVRHCSFCVMNNEFFPLTFDESGRCSACLNAQKIIKREWITGQSGDEALSSMANDLKEAGKGKKYDAMIGLSGGIDSAFLAHYVVKKMGLRVLAVHVDGGWNSVSAVRNIHRLVKNLDIDLFTHVVEWSEMRELQLSFLRSGVLNQDIPQDHVFFSNLYRVANQFDIDIFLSGVNLATENISPPGSGPGYMDAKHIYGINKIFGNIKLKHFRVMGLLEYLWLTRVKGRPRILKPLNFLKYDKNTAEKILKDHYGWEDYGRKHSESRWTKFYQEVYLPKKFKMDKRRLHLSSLIVSGIVSRADAVCELEKPLITEREEFIQTRFIAKKLGISADELNEFLISPFRDHLEFPNSKFIHDTLLKIKRFIQKRTLK